MTWNAAEFSLAVDSDVEEEPTSPHPEDMHPPPVIETAGHDEHVSTLAIMAIFTCMLLYDVL